MDVFGVFPHGWLWGVFRPTRSPFGQNLGYPFWPNILLFSLQTTPQAGEQKHNWYAKRSRIHCWSSCVTGMGDTRLVPGDTEGMAAGGCKSSLTEMALLLSLLDVPV